MLMFTFWVLSSIAFVYAKRRDALFWSDVGLPIFVIVLWYLVAVSGYGHQSLSQFVEVPIGLMVSLIFLYARVFIIDRYNLNFRYNSYVTLVASLSTIILLRTFMPYLPE